MRYNAIFQNAGLSRKYFHATSAFTSLEMEDVSYLVWKVELLRTIYTQRMLLNSLLQMMLKHWLDNCKHLRSYRTSRST